MRARIKTLLIRAGGVPAGHLSTQDTGRGGTRYRFTYLPEAGPEQALSLTMPVPTGGQDRALVIDHLPPALEMSQPEGPLKDYLVRAFAKLLTMDDMGLLFVTGQSRIGNLTAELPPDNTDPELAGLAEALLKSRRQQPETDLIEKVVDGPPEGTTGLLFEDLLRRFADGSGIGGMQPKVLARTQRFMVSSTKHIIKASDGYHPYLALNEALCLRVAAEAGLAVPGHTLANNGETLILERFDIKEDGRHYNLEDGCVLRGQPGADKYEISMEKLTQSLLGAVSGRARLESAQALFTQVVVNTLVRNGDAHAKNFAVLYDTPDEVALSRVYDITTTRAYADYRDDLPAMMMHNKKSWPMEKDLLRYGRQSCQLQERECRAIIQTVIKAVTTVGRTLPKEAAARPAAAPVLVAMVACWNDAIKSLYFRKDGQKQAYATGLDATEKALLEQYGDPYRAQKNALDSNNPLRPESALAGMSCP